MKTPLRYQVRDFRASDARGLATLFQSVYGGLYVYPDVYLPSAIASHNANRRWLSACAIGEGRVIGHAALVFDAGEPCRGEFALNVVDDGWRQQGVARALGEHLVQTARHLPLRYLTIKQVSSHSHSQKLGRSLGFLTSAMFPDYVRSPFDTEGRESVVLGCLPLVPRPVPAIEWPGRVRSCVLRVTALFGEDNRQACLAPRDAGLAISQEGQRIDVHLSTSETNAVREVARLPSSRLVYVQMPLSTNMAYATNTLLDAGYRCAGLVPTGAGEWNLLLVRGHQHATPPHLAEKGIFPAMNAVHARVAETFPYLDMESATASATRMPSMAADMMPPA